MVALFPDEQTNHCRGGVSPPACKEFYPINRWRTSEPPLCKGRCCAPRGTGVVPNTKLSSFSFEQAGTKEKEAKRKCRKGKRQRKLFEKSFLWTPSKTFGQLTPECRVCAPKGARLPISPAARRRRKVGRVHPKERNSRSAPAGGGIRKVPA